MDLIIFLQEYWSFIAGTLAVVTGYAKLQFSITTLNRKDIDIEKRICSIEAEVRDNSKDFTEIKVAIARIEATLVGLHESIVNSKNK